MKNKRRKNLGGEPHSRTEAHAIVSDGARSFTKALLKIQRDLNKVSAPKISSPTNARRLSRLIELFRRAALGLGLIVFATNAAAANAVLTTIEPSETACL